MIRAALALVLLCLLSPALAHDENHEQYPPEILQWMRTLTNQIGGVCCDGKDSIEPAAWRIGPKGNQVRLSGEVEWIDVPPGAVVRQPNVLNRPQVWLYRDDGGPWQVRCFLPGAGG
jgi:hypothetical protein